MLIMANLLAALMRTMNVPVRRVHCTSLPAFAGDALPFRWEGNTLAFPRHQKADRAQATSARRSTADF